ncbi:hypothetical protein L2E82_30091 [Cichorium intybus]|uniref:Uncharacterized protein n=1 Tax=Cichorium intybus TaxID=13427 RepID=A0ACB9CZE9_CICIN|nr:hypothetical protein L2E82_30091 [Cichorium intybus]
MFSGRSGDELLISVISATNFSLANKLVSRYKTFQSDEVLMAIAQNFPCEISTVAEYSDEFYNETLKNASDLMNEMTLCGHWVHRKLAQLFEGTLWIIYLFWRIHNMFVWLYNVNYNGSRNLKDSYAL